MQVLPNHMYGIIVLVLCTGGYVLSWRLHEKQDYRVAVFLLLVCGLLLRIYTSSDPYMHKWDERYHALVAKNLIQHPFTPTLYDRPVLPADYKKWFASHVWVHKQPLPLWSMAISLWLFGINELALRLPSILLSTLGIGFMFSIGTYLFNNRTGFIAAFLFSINGIVVEITGGRIATDHIDLFFLFFVELAVFFSIVFIQRRSSVYNVLTGVSIGAAILSKWLPALIVLPIWLLLVVDSKQFDAKAIFKHFVKLVATVLVVVVPWQIYIYAAFPQEAPWESSYNIRHIFEILDGHGGPWYYYLEQLRIGYGDLIYLTLLWFLWKSMKQLKDFKMMTVAIWFIVPFLFFSFIKTKMEGYILFVAPSLFLITAAFWNELAGMKKGHRYAWLITLVLFLLIALPIRYSIERIRPFMKREGAPPWVADLKSINGKAAYKDAVLFNYPRPIEAMFYTGMAVYVELPDSVVIDSLVKNGRIVLINDDEKVPAGIKSIKGPVFLQLPVKE